MITPHIHTRPQRNYHWFVVGTVCVGAFMAALDASIINVALPVMNLHFHTHMSTIEWVSLSYILTLAALIVPFSRLSDIVGRRGMYILGFSVFIIGSFSCGISPTLPLMFLSRVFQAVGAAMLQANSVSIITSVTPSCDRGKAIGIQASAQGIGLSLGPLLGGLFITFLGWRWIFYINVPVGLIGTLLGVILLPRDTKQGVPEKFDMLGSALLAPALVALIYLLNDGSQQGGHPLLDVLSLAVLVTGACGFYYVEKRKACPIIEFSLFRNRIFRYGNLTVMLSFAVMYSVMFLAPFYLNNTQKINSLTAGAYLTAIPIGMTLMTPLAGIIADIRGPLLPTLTGMLAATAGSGLLCFASFHYTVLCLLVGLFLVGAGMGLFTPPNNSQVMGNVPNNRLGITGGVLNMSRTLGMGFGITLGGLLYQVFLRLIGVRVETEANHVQMMIAFHDAYLIVAVLAFVVVILTVFGQRDNRHKLAN